MATAELGTGGMRRAARIDASERAASGGASMDIQVPGPVELHRYWLVWIDLRSRPDRPSAFHDALSVCATLAGGREGTRIPSAPSDDHSVLGHACKLADATAITQVVHEYAPRFLAFEFDYPTTSTLAALKRVRRRHASLPIVMLTERHSEALAVWAFRAGVWDYLVTPVTTADISRAIRPLFDFASRPTPPGAPRAVASGQMCSPHRERRLRTALAVSHVESHFHEDIRLDAVAALCKLSVFHFSRTFKREHGMPFGAFLQNYRIARATEFLATGVSVKEVAYSIGFNAPSYFDRVFRKCMGLSPSEYRRRLESGSDRPADHVDPSSLRP